MQLSVILKLHFPSPTTPTSSSSSFSLHAWSLLLKHRLYQAPSQLLDLLITRGWLRREKVVAEDVMALFLALVLIVGFVAVAGGVIWAWVRSLVVGEGKGEEVKEEEEKTGTGVRRGRTSVPSSSLALLLPGGNATHRRQHSSSSNKPTHVITTTTGSSNKKRGGASSSSSSSASLPLVLPFSSQWQCVVHDRRATPNLLRDEDLDAVAAAAAGGGGGGGGGVRGKRGRHHQQQQQYVAVAKDVVARLMVDDHKLRGVVLSAKV